MEPRYIFVAVEGDLHDCSGSSEGRDVWKMIIALDSVGDLMERVMGKTLGEVAEDDYEVACPSAKRRKTIDVLRLGR